MPPAALRGLSEGQGTAPLGTPFVGQFTINTIISLYPAHFRICHRGGRGGESKKEKGKSQGKGKGKELRVKS